MGFRFLFTLKSACFQGKQLFNIQLGQSSRGKKRHELWHYNIKHIKEKCDSTQNSDVTTSQLGCLITFPFFLSTALCQRIEISSTSSCDRVFRRKSCFQFNRCVTRSLALRGEDNCNDCIYSTQILLSALWPSDVPQLISPFWFSKDQNWQPSNHL